MTEDFEDEQVKSHIETEWTCYSFEITGWCVDESCSGILPSNNLDSAPRGDIY